MPSLQGKTLLVTGASSGIGRSLCELLVQRGANVLGVTRRPSALSEDVWPILQQYFRGREEALNQTRAAMRMRDPVDVAWAILGILEAPPHVEISDILLRSAEQRM